MLSLFVMIVFTLVFTPVHGAGKFILCDSALDEVLRMDFNSELTNDAL